MGGDLARLLTGHAGGLAITTPARPGPRITQIVDLLAGPLQGRGDFAQGPKPHGRVRREDRTITLESIRSSIREQGTLNAGNFSPR